MNGPPRNNDHRHPIFPLAETPDVYGAYPRLSDPQLDALARLGVRRPVEAGDVLYRQGDLTCDFFVVLDGLVAVVEAPDQVIGVHGRGRFLGELNLLTGEAAFVTAEVRQAGEVLDVPVGSLRKLVCEDTLLGDLILRAYITRRSVLIGLGTGFRLIGSRFSPDTRRLREFAARNRLPHTSDRSRDRRRRREPAAPTGGPARGNARGDLEGRASAAQPEQRSS